MKTLKIKDIFTDGGTQMREKIDQSRVEEYAEILSETDGKGLPPVTVYHDGAVYWLVDGFHRFHAHRESGLGEIRCEVIQGTQREAIKAACGVNSDHGLHRSNGDKRKAVKTLLSDKEWSTRSDRWIAETANVSNTFVSKVRSTVNVDSSNQKRTGKDGKERPATQPTPNTAVSEAFESLNGNHKPEETTRPTPAVQPKDELATQRSKTVKTAEALLRAFDDLQSLKKNPNHGDAIDTCKELLEVARDWK